MKLARKMILLVLGALIVAFGILGYLDTRRIAREYHDRVAQELRVTGQTVAPMLAEVSSAEGEPRAHDLLEKVNAQTPETQLRWLLEKDVDPRAFAQKGAVIDDDHVAVYLPIEGTGGVLEIARPIEGTTAFEREIIERRMVVLGLAALLAAILSSIAAVGMIGTPMKKLTRRARLIGQGEFSGRLRMKRKDEIGVLADAMDAMCDDLAEAQRRTEAETSAKLEAERQVRHADKMVTVGTLAAGMAHELGTPLNVIGGRAKMITTLPSASPDAVKYAEIIGVQAERMKRILRGLLDFARRPPSQRQPTDVSRLTARAVELLQPLATKRDVALTCSSTPDAVSPELDPGQIEQAIVNVLVNGIQAMDHRGTVSAEVHRVRARAPQAKEDRDYVAVSVRDEGPGIDDEDLGHIFEPFFTTKPVGEGTGLGLAVTYGIVHDHGGFIDVDTARGRGTNVTLYLPA